MFVKRVKARNWCQHLETEVFFSKGLNALRGPIGSGKTNLLNALVFAFTGDFSRLHGLKTDNIRKPGGDKASVEVDATHGGVEFKITRSLPSGQKLVVKGRDEPFTTAGDIARELNRILGANERLLLDYVFVPQWGIFNFIDQQPAVRAKAFADLWGADKAEEICKVLTEHKLEIPTAEFDLDKINERLRQHKQDLLTTEQTLSEFTSLPEPWNAETDPNTLKIKAWEHRKRTLDLLTTYREQRKALLAAIDNRAARETAQQAEITELESVLAETRPAVATAKATLKSWTTFEYIKTTKAKLETNLAELHRALAATVEPVPPTDYIKPEERAAFKHKISELDYEKRQLTTYSNNLHWSGKETPCPHCGTPYTELKERVTAYRERLEEVSKELASLQLQLGATEFYDKQLAAHEAQIRTLQSAIGSDEQRLEELPAVEMPTQSKEELKQLISSFEDMERILDRKLQELRNSQVIQSQAQGQLFELDRRLTELNAEPLVEMTEDEYKDAKAELAETSELIASRAKLQGHKANLLQLLKDDEEAKVRCEKEKAENAQRRHLLEHFEDVKGVIKELPKIAAQVNIENMRREINDALSRLGVRFYVHSVEGLNFVLKFPNGKLQPATRLSGGERVLFALAFRIALNSRFASELGLLCLDEPTAGLDEDSQNCLEIALGRLRELSQSSGLQVILITHDSGLDGLFDKVIQLEAPKG